MQKKLTLMLFILCFWGYASTPLTLSSAITEAQEHGPKSIILNREYEIARAQAFQGYGAVLPSFQAKYSDVFKKSPVQDKPDLPPSYSMFTDMFSTEDETKVKTTELSATWMVFSFAGFAAVGAANNAMDLAENQYADGKETLKLEIVKAYYDTIATKRLQELSAKIAEQTERHAREVDIMYTNNLVSKKDSLDARIRLLEARQNAENGILASITTRQSFNALLGKPITADITLATPNITLAPLPSYNIEDLTAEALKNKPGYKAFETLVRLAEADEFGSWGESLPQVFLSYSKQHNTYDKESTYTVNGDTETKMWYAGWNFFSGGGANLHKINEKKNTKEKMYAQRHLMQANVRLAIEAAVRGLRVKHTNYAMALEQAALADESLKIAEINFRNGAGTNTEYTDALNQKLSAESTKIRAAADYIYARANVNYAIGKEVAL